MLTFDQLCRGLEVDISAFAICEVRQGAAFVLAEDADSAVHYVLSGTGVAWRATGEATEISPHTVMIVAPGSRLTITSDPEVVSDSWWKLVFGVAPDHDVCSIRRRGQSAA